MNIIDFKSTINISRAGKNCHIRFGDIDGDGRMEIVMIKPGQVTDKRYFSPQIACVTAFSAEGELLWQIGDPNAEADSSDCELAAQIYDIDKDGKNELILVMNDELLILDGKTSKVKKRAPIPHKYACDCLIIADLDGSGYPQNIILKNKYSKLWAFDVNLNVLWSFEGNIGNTPVAYDVNSDGKEEIIAGGNLLSSTGELIWSVDTPCHISSVCICDKFKGEAPAILMSGPFIGAFSPSGELLWKIEEPAKVITAGKFRDPDGRNELLVLDNLSLFDEEGNFLYQKNETVYLPTVVNNFDNSGRLFLAGHRKEDIATTIYDGYMRTVYTLPSFGKIAVCDIIGDGVPQIIIYNDETCDFYSCAETDLSKAERPYPRQQSKLYYNSSQLNIMPLQQSGSAYLVEDFASQNILKWAESYANMNIYNSFAKVSRSEFVLLLSTLLNLKEEFTENFADVEKDSAYYDAVGTFKKLGITDSEDNMFVPSAPITVLCANEILEKLSLPSRFNFDERYEISKQDMARLILSLNS